MKVIILAAGMGTRLGDLTKDLPKCMVQVGDRPLLQYQLDILRQKELSIALVGGYKSELLAEFEEETVLNEEYDCTNMLWSFYLAIRDLDEEVIISYGDIIYSKSILEKLLLSDSSVSVISDLDFMPYWKGRSEDPLADLETFKTDSGNNIIELGGRPTSIDEVEGQYIGLVKINRETLSLIKEIVEVDKEVNGKPVRNAYFTDLLQELISRQVNLQAVPVRGEWIEVDTPEDINCEVAQVRLNKIKEVNYEQ